MKGYLLFSQDLLPPLRTAILASEWRLLGLFFQQPRCEIDVVSGNLADVQYIQNVLAVEEAEQLVCRPVVQLFSCVGIDVTHHKSDIVLCQVIE